MIARAHGFKRTGEQIKNQILNSINNARETSHGPDGERVYWPKESQVEQVVPFRGMSVNAEVRDWKDVPYPEKLGLAKECANSHNSVAEMAKRVGLGRLSSKTSEEFELLLVPYKK
jgi:hypothetical protein